MLDYEEYGSSFRTPKPMRPDGGPENNSFDQTSGETTQPEGRPRTAQPDDGQPAGPTPDKPAAPSPGQAAAAPPQTFAMMQQNGLARPPAPMTNPMVSGGQQFGGSKTDMVKYGANGVPMGGTNASANMVQYGGGMANGGYPGKPVGDPSVGGGPQGGGSLEDQLRQQWEGAGQGGPTPTPTGQFGGQYTPQGGPQNRFTGQFNGDPNGDAFGGGLQTSLAESLRNPSRYDTNVAKDSFNMLSGEIDDDYNARDQGLRESVSSRGLGAIGDGTIGTADQRFQNLQRRSAKQNMASGILREQANTYGADRSSAIGQAMGFGQNRFQNQLGAFGANQGANESNFGQDMQGRQFAANENQRGFGNSMDAYNTNRQTNDQNWNQNMQGRQFGANQKQQAWNNYSGYGQQAFDNQMRTSDQQGRRQQQDYDNLMRMLGY